MHSKRVWRIVTGFQIRRAAACFAAGWSASVGYTDFMAGQPGTDESQTTEAYELLS